MKIMNFFNKDPFVDGAVGHDDPRDWTAESLWEDLSSLAIPKLRDPKTKLNQGLHKHTKSSCTISWSYMQKAQIFNEIANNDELLEIVERCNKNMWYDYKGQYSSTWINMMVKYHNKKNPKDKILFIKKVYNDKDIDFLTDKNFLLWCTYKGNRDYWKDFRKDAILNGTKFKPSTYGHRTNFRKGYIEDQYYGGSCNRYRLGVNWNSLPVLVRNWVFFPTMYIILKESRLTKKTIKQIALEQKEKRFADMFINSNSLFWKFLSQKEKTVISTLVEKYRKKYSIKKHKNNSSKVAAVLIASAAELLDGVPVERKWKLLEALIKIT